MQILEINSDNPQARYIEQTVEILRKGGIIIYPTDSVYAMGCDLFNSKAIEKLCRIKNIKPEKAQFSFMCNDISHISEYCKQVDNTVFKLMKKTLPGPYTYILKAGNKVPKLVQAKKKTVGIRVPDHAIVRDIVTMLGNPIITTSIKDEDEILEYSTDPYAISERFQHLVDLMIDGGYGNNIPTTVIDCSNDDIELVRKGLGDIDDLIQ